MEDRSFWKEVKSVGRLAKDTVNTLFDESNQRSIKESKSSLISDYNCVETFNITW